MGLIHESLFWLTANFVFWSHVQMEGFQRHCGSLLDTFIVRPVRLRVSLSGVGPESRQWMIGRGARSFEFMDLTDEAALQ